MDILMEYEKLNVVSVVFFGLFCLALFGVFLSIAEQVRSALFLVLGLLAVSIASTSLMFFAISSYPHPNEESLSEQAEEIYGYELVQVKGNEEGYGGIFKNDDGNHVQCNVTIPDEAFSKVAYLASSEDNFTVESHLICNGEEPAKS